MFKPDSEKAEEPEIKLSATTGSTQKARELQKNIYFCFTDYTKAFDCVDHNKLWKILKEMGIPDHLTCILRNLMQVKKARVTTEHRTDWFQIQKGVHLGYISYPAYLTSMQSTSGKMPSWMKHKLESRLRGWTRRQPGASGC